MASPVRYDNIGEDQFSVALQDCADRLAAGQSVDDCLAAHPEFAVDLSLMIAAGLSIPGTDTNQPQQSVQHAVHSTQAMVRLRPYNKPIKTSHVSSTALLLMAAIVIMLIVAVSVMAEKSLPGDSLYGWKRLTENVRMIVAGDTSDVLAQFNQRRRAEILQLLALKRSTNISFEGTIQAIDGQTWHVSDMTLTVPPDVPGAFTAFPGDLIQVQSQTTAQGELVANSIVLILPDPYRKHTTPTPTARASVSSN